MKNITFNSLVLIISLLIFNPLFTYAKSYSSGGSRSYSSGSSSRSYSSGSSSKSYSGGSSKSYSSGIKSYSTPTPVIPSTPKSYSSSGSSGSSFSGSKKSYSDSSQSQSKSYNRQSRSYSSRPSEIPNASTPKSKVIIVNHYNKNYYGSSRYGNYGRGYRSYSGYSGYRGYGYYGYSPYYHPYADSNWLLWYMVLSSHHNNYQVSCYTAYYNPVMTQFGQTQLPLEKEDYTSLYSIENNQPVQRQVHQSTSNPNEDSIGYPFMMGMFLFFIIVLGLCIIKIGY